MKLVLYFIALLSFACVKETNTVTNNGGSNPITSGTTTTTTTSATTSGGSGSSCTGTVADGYCEGTSCYPLHIRNIGLAGKTDWAAVPDSIWNPVTHEGLPTYSNQQVLTNTVDQRLRVRVKVLPQMPVPPGCPQRTTGSPTFPEYTKLKVKIKLYTQSGSTMVEIPGGMFELGPIDVNSCSQIVDIPYSSLQAGWANPVVLGVADVRSDFECMFFGEGGTTPRCPAEKQVTSKTCWNVILQVATDATDNFL